MIKNRQTQFGFGFFLGIFAILSMGFTIWRPNFHRNLEKKDNLISEQQLDPTPTVDRLAEPDLPENPTQVEIGENLYYHHCMPCHGDYGQGLTDEFRAVWVDDHQNCWAGGCHGGRSDDGGFPIPKYVPAVIVSESVSALQKFITNEDLYNFLIQKHPPKSPGVLEDHEYWALTAFLLAKSGRLSSEMILGAEVDEPLQNLEPTNNRLTMENVEEIELSTESESRFPIEILILVFLAILLGALTFFWLKNKTVAAPSEIQEQTQEKL